MDEALLDELRQALPDLLYHWSPTRTDHDTVCVFCHLRPGGDQHTDHEPTCLGMRLHDTLVRERPDDTSPTTGHIGPG